MIDPIRACLLATIVAWISAFVVDGFVPYDSPWVLTAGACGFIGTLLIIMLSGLRKL